MAMLTLDRIRAAIGKSGYSTQAVFDRLSCGRGKVLRIDFANLARKLEPGLTDEQLTWLWHQTGKSRGGALSYVEFVKFFGDASSVAQLPVGLLDLLGQMDQMQAIPSPKAAWPPPMLTQSPPYSDAASGSPSPAQELSPQFAGSAMLGIAAGPGLSQHVPQVNPSGPASIQPNAFQTSVSVASTTPLQAPPPQVSNVASDWVECTDPGTGRRFFYNANERRSSWTDPRTREIAAIAQSQSSNDWVECEEPGTGRKYYYNAAEGRSSWTDPRPACERRIEDGRFKQLMEYFNQVVQSRGHTATVYFEFVDVDKDGHLTSEDFIRGLADLGVHGAEQAELQLVFNRIAGAGAGSAFVAVGSVVRAVTDPAGFLTGSTALQAQASPTVVDPGDVRCAQLLEYLNQTFLSRGHTAAVYFDYIDLNKDGYLTIAEFIQGLADLGVNGVDHSELQQLFKRIAGSGGDYALVSSLVGAVTDPTGYLSKVPSPVAQPVLSAVPASAAPAAPAAAAAAPAAVEIKQTIINEARFTQLLEYTNNVVRARGQTAFEYLTAFDLDRDGNLSISEFVKMLRDLGLREGIESTELRQIFQRIEGPGSVTGVVAISSLAAAISDPLGFLAGHVKTVQPMTPVASLSSQRRIIVQLRPSSFKKLGFGASRSSDDLALLVDRIDPIGLLAEWNLQQIQLAERVQVGDQIAEVNGQNANPAQIAQALKLQGLLTIVFVRRDQPGDSTKGVLTGGQIIEDARFKQLLEYFNQVLLSRGCTAAMYFEAIDLNKHGCLSAAEFIKGLTDLGVSGVEHTELQKVFQRVEGSGLDSSQALVSSIIAAITDPSGFIARGDTSTQPALAQASEPARKRLSVQLRTSAVKKLGFGASRSEDGKALLVSRVDASGLLAEWNAGQKRTSEKVRKGDQIAEVNGQSTNLDAIAKALQSQGFLNIVFTRLDQKATDLKNNIDVDKIIDDARFKQLLEYFNQVLLSRGYTAAMYFDALDLNKDGRLSVAEFIKGLAELGVNGVELAELQNVLQRIKGGGLETSQAQVIAIVDAITDPTGFAAKGGGIRFQSPALQTSVPSHRRLSVQLRTSPLRKLGLGASRSDDGLTLLVSRIDPSGLLADWNAQQKRSSERVRIGDQIAEVNGQSANPDGMVKALQSQGLLTIVFIRPDSGAAESKAKVDVRNVIADDRFKQLLEYFNQVLLSRGQTASTYFNAIDLNKVGRLSCADFIKGLTDLGVNGVEHSELQKIFQRIDGSGLDSAQAPTSSIVDAIVDPAGFIAKGDQTPQTPTAQAFRKRITATLVPSAFKKLGFGVLQSDDGFALVVSRIDNIGVLADWNAEQKRSSDRVRVADQIADVNGQSANPDTIAKTLQSQGPLTIVFARPEKTSTDVKSKTEAGKTIDDARFAELLETINKTLSSARRDVSKYFASADVDKDGSLNAAEFIKAITDLGIQGLEISELQKVLLRIKGGQADVPVLVNSVVDAVTNPAGFIAKGPKGSEPQPAPAGLSTSGRITIQLRPSFFKKLGVGVSPAEDRRTLLITRIDTNGLVADWNAEQKLPPDRVQIGDQIVEVNGQGANADELSKALQSQGLLTVVFVRRSQNAVAKKSKVEGKQIIDDARFKQLLVHFNAKLVSRGQSALKYFQSLDLNGDGRLSITEFTKGLMDLGISGMDRTELQKVFRRIEGSGSDMAHVPISSVVDAFTNPTGFAAKN